MALAAKYLAQHTGRTHCSYHAPQLPLPALMCQTQCLSNTTRLHTATSGCHRSETDKPLLTSKYQQYKLQQSITQTRMPSANYLPPRLPPTTYIISFAKSRTQHTQNRPESPVSQTKKCAKQKAKKVNGIQTSKGGTQHTRESFTITNTSSQVRTGHISPASGQDLVRNPFCKAKVKNGQQTGQ